VLVLVEQVEYEDDKEEEERVEEEKNKMVTATHL